MKSRPKDNATLTADDVRAEALSSTAVSGTIKQSGLSGLLQNKKALRIIILSAFVLTIILVLSIFVYRAYRVPTLTEITNAQNKQENKHAEELLHKAIRLTKSKPQKAYLYVRLANTLDNENNGPAAIRAYEDAAATNGMTGSIAKQLAYKYLAINDNKNAAKYLQQAITLWPKNSPLYDSEIESFKADLAAAVKAQ
ncbi:MAG: hypothetical protein QFB87_00275 [Patescibacteria group bacterium]|nr:hypothetical protein [Patescibacteria group bacterium]